MYQALYRKYRPADFDNVVGQDIIVKTLENAVLNNKISHAYLFIGPRGTGKTSIAKLFAKTINCKSLNGIHPCNDCVSCTQINNKQSTDIIEIDAASNNGVEEIRDLRSKVSLVPNVSKYKVYIIDEVHMLTTGAFNALLKTLEEPPSHVVFILATTEPQKIPATILSRCQQYDFKKIPNDRIVERLKYICEKENITIDNYALQEIARISDGGLRDAISILDQVISYKENNIQLEDVHMVNGTLTQNDLKEFIINLLNNNIEEVFNLLDKYNNDGKNLNKLVDEIILFLRNSLLYYEVPGYLKKNDIDVTPYQEIKSMVNIDKIYRIINNFNSLSLKMKNSSNSKILFELEILNSIDNGKNISREIKTEYKQPVKTAIKEEKKIEETFNIDINTINHIRNIRINNVLTNLKKSIILNVLEKRNRLKPYLLDNKYGKYVSLLLDGNIKAGSSDGLIYVYDYESDSKLFNNNILILEKILNLCLNQKYKLISTSINDWNNIKNDYNSKTKNYNYIDEDFAIDEIYSSSINKQESDELLRIFKDLVTYTKEEI